jgi:uncharacterized protein YchJ
MKYLLILLLLLSACDTSSFKDVNISLIRDVLFSVKSAFRSYDLETIMSFYHPEFRHNEDSFLAEKERWQIRLIDYLDLEIAEIEVIFSNEYWAVVSFSLTFISQNQTTTSQEPSDELGDLSYFVKESGVWRICGKDFAAID